LDQTASVARQAGDIQAKTAIDGFWFGLSKRSWTLT
jgi:4,5-DOPA dioxygenase extradiol